jgi:hypothetical protein
MGSGTRNSSSCSIAPEPTTLPCISFMRTSNLSGIVRFVMSMTSARGLPLPHPWPFWNVSVTAEGNWRLLLGR